MFQASTRWRELYPRASIGVLALQGVTNPSTHAALEHQKEALEAELRRRYGDFSRAELRALPTVAPYVAYYKRFNKTYHVLQQLESVAVKHKPIPRTATLVEAMFMAELNDHLLTAGHDLDAVQGPASISVATGAEKYTGLGGRDLNTKEGDMMITDEAGILSSILYGPDQRTRIRPTTTRVLFTVYAPEGISSQQVEAHLLSLKDNVLLVSPQAELVEEQIVGSN